MKTSRNAIVTTASMLFLALGTTTIARADKAAEDQLRKMIAANSLDGDGKAPFHIKIAFQYYDLDGKAAEAGTVEEWWVSPTQYRTVIVSPSANEVFPATADQTPEVRNREAFLVHELLNSAVHPFPHYSTFEGLDVRAGKHSADGAALTCVLVEAFDPSRPYLATPTFCAEPKTGALRLRSNLGASSIARNSIGVFHDVNVSLDYQISYGLTIQEKMAITGHVTSLGTFDPTKSTLALGAPVPDRVDENSVPETFVKGKLVFERPAKYPLFEIATNKSANVAVRGLIMKDGSVTAPVVMSSPDSAFGAAAIESVNDWKYRPYAAGGTKLEVYADFYVSFVPPDPDHTPGASH